MAHVVVGQLEAAAPVVVLLGYHAVQADQPALQPGHGRLPQRQPVALAAPGRVHDVEADEAEAAAVLHGRHHADRLAVQSAEQEAAGVAGMEAVAIVQAGVPPFVGGPADADVQLGACHGVDALVAHDLAPQYVDSHTEHDISASERTLEEGEGPWPRTLRCLPLAGSCHGEFAYIQLSRAHFVRSWPSAAGR